MQKLVKKVLRKLEIHLDENFVLKAIITEEENVEKTTRMNAFETTQYMKNIESITH
jgi:hypothetical protein